MIGCGDSRSGPALPPLPPTATAPTVASPAAPRRAAGYRVLGQAQLVLTRSGEPAAVHFRVNRELPKHTYDATAAADATIASALDLHGAHHEGRATRHCYRAPIAADYSHSSEPVAGTRLPLVITIRDVPGVVRARVLVVAATRWRLPRACI
jgi:hypothetical protein